MKKLCATTVAAGFADARYNLRGSASFFENQVSCPSCGGSAQKPAEQPPTTRSTPSTNQKKTAAADAPKTSSSSTEQKADVVPVSGAASSSEQNASAGASTSPKKSSPLEEKAGAVPVSARASSSDQNASAGAPTSRPSSPTTDRDREKKSVFAISAPAESCESAISIWKEKILQRQDVCNGDQVPSSAKEVEKEWLDEAMETATADDTRILAEKCCISEKEHEEEMQTRKELDRAKEQNPTCNMQ